MPHPRYPQKLSKYIPRLRHLSLRKPDEEICGYISEGRVMPLKNTSDNIRESFKLSKAGQRAIDAAINREGRENVYLYHSHPQSLSEYYDAMEFSAQDIAILDAANLQGILIHTQTGAISHYDPATIAPLTGRRWVTSHQNCYTLIKDWYKIHRGIELGHYYLHSTDAPQQAGWNDFEESIASEGFKLVSHSACDEILTGDLVLFKLGRTVNSNHIGVIHDAEKNLLMHHPGSQVSLAEPYGKLLRRTTHQVWRYVGSA